jgi:hypothetical protein
MTEEDKLTDGGLVAAGRNDLVPVTSTNPLILQRDSFTGVLQYILKLKADLAARRADLRLRMQRLQRFADALDPPPRQAPYLDIPDALPGGAAPRLDQLNAPPDPPESDTGKPGSQKQLDENE